MDQFRPCKASHSLLFDIQYPAPYVQLLFCATSARSARFTNTPAILRLYSAGPWLSVNGSLIDETSAATASSNASEIFSPLRIASALVARNGDGAAPPTPIRASVQTPTTSILS